MNLSHLLRVPSCYLHITLMITSLSLVLVVPSYHLSHHPHITLFSPSPAPPLSRMVPRLTAPLHRGDCPDPSCPTGQYQAGSCDSTSNTLGCSACQRGTFKSNEGPETSCTPCPLGKHQGFAAREGSGSADSNHALRFFQAAVAPLEGAFACRIAEH